MIQPYLFSELCVSQVWTLVYRCHFRFPSTELVTTPPKCLSLYPEAAVETAGSDSGLRESP